MLYDEKDKGRLMRRIIVLLKNILNIPYITNTIKKNDILKNIQDIISNENYKEDESSSEQIDELISCIQSNLQSN